MHPPAKRWTKGCKMLFFIVELESIEGWIRGYQHKSEQCVVVGFLLPWSRRKRNRTRTVMQLSEWIGTGYIKQLFPTAIAYAEIPSIILGK